jgi:hypothetical protein
MGESTHFSHREPQSLLGGMLVFGTGYAAITPAYPAQVAS